MLLDWGRLPRHTHLDALTVTDQAVADERQRTCLIAVPHGHEPTGTVAGMNFISRLLDGQDLDGTPARLDRERILRKTRLTFIPEGRSEPTSSSAGARFLI